MTLDARPSLTIAAWRDRLRDSLFFVPVLFVVGGVILAGLAQWGDRHVTSSGWELPWTVESSIGGARAVLTTVAGATVTVAGIAFSVALLVLQLASSQYSPRVIGSLFRDRFNKRIIGIVVGTFAYCVIALRSLGDSVEGEGAVTPSLSVGIAVLLGLASVLAIVAFINHSAHTMQISELLHRITASGLDAVAGRDRLGVVEAAADVTEPVTSVDVPAAPGFVVTAEDHGWLQQVDTAALLGAVAPGSTVRLDTTPGRYVATDSSLCTIWPHPSPADREEVCGAVRQAVRLGRTRTTQQDVAYAIRQLADVAIKALSPGINDPTTAQDAIFHLVTVLQAALELPEPGPVRSDRGCVLLPAEDAGHRELVDLAFSEIRRDAATRPTVCVYLLEAIRLTLVALPDDGDGPGTSRARTELLRQARLVVDGCTAAGALPEDLAAVRAAFEHRFGGDG